MPTHYSISDIARRLGVRPRVISDLFYQRQLSDEACPVVSGRRLIPAEYVPVIESILRRQRQAQGETTGPEGST